MRDFRKLGTIWSTKRYIVAFTVGTMLAVCLILIYLSPKSGSTQIPATDKNGSPANNKNLDTEPPANPDPNAASSDPTNDDQPSEEASPTPVDTEDTVGESSTAETGPKSSAPFGESGESGGQETTLVGVLAALEDGNRTHAENDQDDEESDSENTPAPNPETNGKDSTEKEQVVAKVASTNPFPKEEADSLLQVAAEEYVADLAVCPLWLADYVPCTDNKRPRLRVRRETGRMPSPNQKYLRVCPQPSEDLMCLLPHPPGYKEHVKWPQSKDEIWFDNVPHPRLVTAKASQNWVRREGDKLVFPGGGTQFVDGADKYVDRLQELVPDIAWGVHTRVLLDVGCGVASMSAALDRHGVRVQSVAPKDSHEAQVQMALERGLPAVLGIVYSERLNYPSNSFDAVHCARCRIRWYHGRGDALLEMNRLIRPGGYFIWSATPIYRTGSEDVEDWNATKSLADQLCWELIGITKDATRHWGVAIWRKPTSNDCYNARATQVPPVCPEDDRPDSAWYTPITACIHKVPTEPTQRGAKWPVPARKPLDGSYNEQERSFKAPEWLTETNSAALLKENTLWLDIVRNVYSTQLGIDWSTIRNVLDLNPSFGGFGAALEAVFEPKLWVMNAVSVKGPDTLPVIYDRGLLGIYHNWCEAFSTYPRTYDLLHANFVLWNHHKSCSVSFVFLEMDRIARPNSWIIIRDNNRFADTTKDLAKALHWEEKYSSGEDGEFLLVYKKTFWRPAMEASSDVVKLIAHAHTHSDSH